MDVTEAWMYGDVGMFDRFCRWSAVPFLFLFVVMGLALAGCNTAPKAASDAQAARDAETLAKLVETLRTKDPSQPTHTPPPPALQANAGQKKNVAWAPGVAPVQPGVAKAAPGAPKREVKFLQEGDPRPVSPTTLVGGPLQLNPNPVQTIESIPADQSQLIQELSQSLRKMPADQGLRPLMRRAALSLFDPRLTLGESDLKDLTESQRQTVLAYQRIFTQLGQRLGEARGSDREQLHLAARELSDQLQQSQVGQLSIRTTKICSNVTGYGQYVPMGNEFAAGAVNRLILYTEVENYRSKKTNDGWYEVRLTQQVQLFAINDSAVPVWSLRAQRVVDRSKSLRHDFITVQSLQLPNTLSPGRYNFKVRLTDQAGQYVDEAIIPIRVGVGARLASDRADESP
jgi:hypothetical protein